MTPDLHDLRNWLHQFVLAMQAAHDESLHRALATDGRFVIDEGEGHRHTTPGQWLTRLRGRPEGPGIRTLSIRFRPPPHFDATAEGVVAAWNMEISFPDSRERLPFHCRAELIREEGRWVAASVVCAPPQAQSGSPPADVPAAAPDSRPAE